MQTRRDLIAAAAKLTTGVKHGQNGLERTKAGFFVLVYWNTATIIVDTKASVFKDRYVNPACVSGNCLVNRVVGDFFNKMV